jgi:PTS system N-acetylglucosamine-specific IIC component
MKNLLSGLQKLGRAMMLPIAVLPVAALLLRLGQPDLLDVPAIAAAGDAIFANLGLLFAIGIAVGLARENHGAAGLAGVVAYLITTKGAELLLVVPSDVTAGLGGAALDLAERAYRAKEIAKLSVPAGILCGLLAGALYNRYSDVRLPAYLAFFGGRRFVPIVSGFAGILLALCFGYGFPILEHGMDSLSRAVLGSESIGLFAYGVLNRALIITGLHHIANNMAWFLIGDFPTATGVVTGDLKRFFAGDPSAGAFMSGFFPVMMFGLPAACLAMYQTARPERRKAVGGMLLSMALTSFLTGVTEPIEFAFMFLAPVLYALHALLTGLAMVVMDFFNVKLGFGFSAGLFDYVLNFSLATNPLMLIPIGAFYFALYYFAFRFAITRFDLKTPGREAEEGAAAEAPVDDGAESWIRALGGAANIVALDACTTRLRLNVAGGAIDEAALRRLGARGFVRPSDNTLQVVVGPIADQLADRLRQALRGSTAGPDLPAAPHSASPTVAEPDPPPAPGPIFTTGDVRALAAAFGGAANLAGVEVHSTRIGVTLKNPEGADPRAIQASGFRGAVRVADALWHVIVGPDSGAVADQLRGVMRPAE